jgi:hypothetical protein
VRHADDPIAEVRHRVAVCVVDGTAPLEVVGPAFGAREHRDVHAGCVHHLQMPVEVVELRIERRGGQTALVAHLPRG